MAGYEVDQQMLRDTARALDQAAESLRDATRALRDTSRIDLGADGLDDVAHQLLTVTTSSMDRELAGVTDSASGVRRCLGDYADTEQRIIDLLRGGGLA